MQNVTSDVKKHLSKQQEMYERIRCILNMHAVLTNNIYVSEQFHY